MEDFTPAEGLATLIEGFRPSEQGRHDSSRGTGAQRQGSGRGHPEVDDLSTAIDKSVPDVQF